jgi:hypothetical protein
MKNSKEIPTIFPLLMFFCGKGKTQRIHQKKINSKGKTFPIIPKKIGFKFSKKKLISNSKIWLPGRSVN